MSKPTTDQIQHLDEFHRDRYDRDHTERVYSEKTPQYRAKPSKPMQVDITSIGPYSVFTVDNHGSMSTQFRHGDSLLFSLAGTMTEADKEKHLMEFLAPSPGLIDKPSSIGDQDNAKRLKS